MAFIFMKKIFFILTLASATVYPQQYPHWFLYQSEVSCKPTIVSIVGASTFYRDSAIAQGFRTGCDLLAKYSNVEIAGGQGFIATESGTFAMGADYAERYDSSLSQHFAASLKVLDTYTDKQKTIVLAGDPSCSLLPSFTEKIAVENITQPQWVEELPKSREYNFGVGLSQEYFTEISSWQTAERNAFLSLARSMQIKLQGLQKRNQFEHSDVRNEDLDVRLQNVEIVARWRDTKRKIFYVLARAKR